TCDMIGSRDSVTRAGQAVDPEEVLQNKIVGLYFSAGWCSPCRDFTPLLCDFYTELLEGAQPPAPFEIVLPAQSWLALGPGAQQLIWFKKLLLAQPFHDPYKHDLKKKYNITAIPKLVIVKQTGEVITDKGRKQIRERGLTCFRNWLEGADVFQNFSN
uniref:Nucleoredoxin like 2 n=1 Tax=Pelodiscus sinensis TaxID=13735 RepID=K7GEY8_PELSI